MRRLIIVRSVDQSALLPLTMSNSPSPLPPSPSSKNSQDNLLSISPLGQFLPVHLQTIRFYLQTTSLTRKFSRMDTAVQVRIVCNHRMSRKVYPRLGGGCPGVWKPSQFLYHHVIIRSGIRHSSERTLTMQQNNLNVMHFMNNVAFPVLNTLSCLCGAKSKLKKSG